MFSLFSLLSWLTVSAGSDLAYSPYCGRGGVCVAPVDCAPHYLSSLHHPSSSCLLAPGTPGLCCYGKKAEYTKKRPLLTRASFPSGSKSPLDFDAYSLNHAAKVGKLEVEWINEFESELSRRRIFVKEGSAAASHFALFKSKPRARRMSDDSMMIVFGSQDLSDRFSLSPDQAGFGLTAFSTAGTILEEKCPKGGPCDPNSRYRELDGSCNNLDNPLWGSTNTPFQRTLLPQYSDGVWRPKVSKAGTALPSARLVSINIIPDVDAPSELDTHNVMQWGQFVDHDITHTPLFRLSNENSTGIQCCKDDGSAPISKLVLHPECFPIEIPSNDPFFSRHGQRCMNFVRSMPAPQLSCTFGYGEQMNQITHFHDGSNLYGSDEEDARDLRELRGGLMKFQVVAHGKGLLPQETGDEEGEECQIEKRKQERENKKCFSAGDSRSNEQPGLTVYHTVWVREHNRVATQLSHLNTHWDDERLYQEARRIVVAEMQHITYNEWLPIVLGVDFMEELDILPLSYGYSTRYDAKVNPTVINAFATAAFRFGHSLIQGMLDLVKEVQYERKTHTRVPLSDAFFNPELIYSPGKLDEFLVGLATQPSQKYDNIVTEEVTNHLFQAKNKSFGMDLVALNIQRGRDHGLPGYNAFRELCGLGRVKSFSELSDLIPQAIVERFQLIYHHPDDVDLFIGGLSESSVPGGLVGPTFQCLVGDQFKRTMSGDRYFYESAANPGKLTEPQLGEIRKSSLARITCDNGDNIHLIQPLAFRKTSAINPLVPCNAITIPLVNLTPWQEVHTRHSSHLKTPVSPYNYHHSPVYSPTPTPSPAPPYSPISSLFPGSSYSKLRSLPSLPSRHRFNVNINFGK